jgi:hypothetical protein
VAAISDCRKGLGDNRPTVDKQDQKGRPARGGVRGGRSESKTQERRHVTSRDRVPRSESARPVPLPPSDYPVLPGAHAYALRRGGRQDGAGDRCAPCTAAKVRRHVM